MAVNLAEAQHFIFVTQIIFCSVYAVVLWDWVVCLPREYRFIWKSSWTAAKCSYLFCRYWVMIVIPWILYCYIQNHTEERCLKIFKSPVALAMWNQAGAEVVLLIRTYAFFNRNQYLFVALLAMLCGVFAYQLYVILHEMLLLPFVTPPFTSGPCLPMSRPRSAHILGFFMASLAFDATVTTITLAKAFSIRIRYGASGSPLIATFLREGVFYFVLISMANLINGIFYLQSNSNMSALNIPLTIMFSDVLACRMILDLRSRGYEISQPTTQHGPTLPLSGGRFQGTNETSTFEGDDIKRDQGQSGSSEQLAYHDAPLSYSSSNGRGGGKKSNGLRGLLEAGRGSSALTATINSTIFSTTSSSQMRSAGATSSSSDSVELRSLSQDRLAEEDKKSGVHSFGLTSVPSQLRSLDEYADDERVEE